MEYLKQCLACDSNKYQPFMQTPAMMHQHLPYKYNFDVCHNCGLVFLNPRVPGITLGQFYTAAYLPYRVEQAWGKYASFVKEDQRNIDHARVSRLKKYHKLSDNSRILDIGCGKPTFLAALSKHSSAQLIGLDFTDEGWKDENENYYGIDLRIGEVADLSAEKPVDVITMWHYLEHDYQPKQHLQQLLDIAHPQTQLIVEVPNFNSYTQRKFGQHWAGFHTPRHTALYSPENIVLLMKNSGWQVKQVLTYGTLDPYTLHWMSQMEKNNIDWAASMEKRFMSYVLGKVFNTPIYMWQKWFSMGFMTVIAEPIMKS